MPTTVSISDKVQRQLWTANDFLDWLQPGRHADLIGGEPIMLSPVNFRHADLLNFLHLTLGLYIESKSLGRLYREVVAVRLSSRSVFLPDLCYFTTDQVRRLPATFAPFAPTFVVEVLSPESVDRDTGPKFAAYEEHGVQEYWILDPETLAHRFYHREGDLLVEFGEGEEVIQSSAISGFWIKRSWMNPAALPGVQQSFSEILQSPA